jgi:pyruvate/2-oxoglutarate/acetoin dehydrogenase E1 component
MTTMTCSEAAIAAMREEMHRDANVWAVGEDLGRGGVFGQYRGLQDEFGPQRVVDTPISESAIVGVAVGAAMLGSRPVAEMRFADFALCAMDELINQAAKARFMFGGQARVPMVIREPIGLWRFSAAQHSQSLEAWYVHVPGLVVVCPSTPSDVRGLLKSAIRCDDPVVLMEHKDLWPFQGEVDLAADGAVELGQAAIRRAGDDITIVSWSAQVHRCVEAAEMLAADGVDAEVIDLRTLWPWDKNAVAESLRKTGRLLVAHEAVAVGGFGAEVAAYMAEHEGHSLRAPVARLGAPRVPVGYARTIENEVRVTAEAVAARAKELVKS